MDVPLMCYGVSLKNVKNLIIEYDQLELIEPRVLSILKDFDFNQIFPSLDKVLVSRGSGFDSHTPEHMSKTEVGKKTVLILNSHLLTLTTAYSCSLILILCNR